MVTEALWQIENLGLVCLQNNLVDWNIDGELLLYHSKVYIPKDDALRAEIVRILHDLPSAGHLGQWKTVELISHNYWWPGMTKFIRDYVNT